MNEIIKPEIEHNVTDKEVSEESNAITEHKNMVLKQIQECINMNNINSELLEEIKKEIPFNDKIECIGCNLLFDISISKEHLELNSLAQSILLEIMPQPYFPYDEMFTEDHIVRLIQADAAYIPYTKKYMKLLLKLYNKTQKQTFSNETIGSLLEYSFNVQSIRLISLILLVFNIEDETYQKIIPFIQNFLNNQDILLAIKGLTLTISIRNDLVSQLDFTNILNIKQALPPDSFIFSNALLVLSKYPNIPLLLSESEIKVFLESIDPNCLLSIIQACLLHFSELSKDIQNQVIHQSGEYIKATNVHNKEKLIEYTHYMPNETFLQNLEFTSTFIEFLGISTKTDAIIMTRALEILISATNQGLTQALEIIVNDLYQKYEEISDLCNNANNSISTAANLLLSVLNSNQNE
ncbi:hypothetical protein TVAG_120100 [Trichomonas vaginalis G3]|uniref:Uncharacterized protein n=1 Tax=Trichomonas vaginalis (strain ATCC PRA-98 / G3) TaxID=412133 RepID=A2D7F6_TRIV3|nr:hypothetical protein TVAGG3_0993010 [Trichomonas vaginalis G3]EAY23673.1 hypothetical protein TVAG_120100 [Trichomonas vaginalis G3]KAI5490165.1 hypothetical protein TVAGG3_0993010 [Trichomonas vaginalis G3]|eukprot:XP_001276921.1 hypothetical protein [Trichomonas vaginalis G3]